MRRKICLQCSRLGKCDDVTLEMLKGKKGCGSWFAAHPKTVEARLEAVALVGSPAYEAMLFANPRRIINRR